MTPKIRALAQKIKDGDPENELSALRDELQNVPTNRSYDLYEKLRDAIADEDAVDETAVEEVLAEILAPDPIDIAMQKKDNVSLVQLLIDLQWMDVPVSNEIIEYVMTQGTDELVFIVARSNVTSEQAVRLSKNPEGVRGLAENRDHILDYYRQFLQSSRHPGDWNSIATCAEYAEPQIVDEIRELAWETRDFGIILDLNYANAIPYNLASSQNPREAAKNFLTQLVYDFRSRNSKIDLDSMIEALEGNKSSYICERISSILNKDDISDFIFDMLQQKLLEIGDLSDSMAARLVEVLKKNYSHISAMQAAAIVTGTVQSQEDLFDQLYELTGYDRFENQSEVLDAIKGLPREREDLDLLLHYVLVFMNGGLK